MRRIFVLFFLVVALGGWSGSEDAADTAVLFPAYEKGYYGFVNEKGRMQIKPRFQQAGYFQGGMALVLEGSQYGYIDTKGQYVIEPRFDEARPFGENGAEVTLNGKKYLIDRQGAIRFEHPYRDWMWADSQERRLIVTTQGGRQGVIDTDGGLILDTIYHFIAPFSEGLTTVVRYDAASADGDGLKQLGVFDADGKLVVPFGRFDQIDPFRNGYARVAQRPKRGAPARKTFGVINREGEVQFLLKDKLIDFIDSESMYQEGLAEIAIYTADRDTVSPERQEEIYAYRGVIDPEGKIVFSHPQVKDITPFEKGRAFAKTTNHAWVLIDRQGKRVGKDFYQSVPGEGFASGAAVVGMEDGLALIDTEGRLLLPPADLKTTYYQRNGDAVFFEVEILEKDTYIRRWGFWDLQTGQIAPPRYVRIDAENGFRNGLVQVEEDGRQGYVSRTGKYVWRAGKG